ncbi:hypothetical protein [Tellurirhabdus bombi]|uniref:hypothetical protein n=1 Tax=Tellurirhabdus bombi TaxID=2907205 RepID=UPI001F1CCAC5|nr:hypothetical protein [Tellurirhabdus bombi]
MTNPGRRQKQTTYVFDQSGKLVDTLESMSAAAARYGYNVGRISQLVKEERLSRGLYFSDDADFVPSRSW